VIFCLHPKQSERDIYNLWEDGAPHKQKKAEKGDSGGDQKTTGMTRVTDFDF
jgi:hypothetical protein